MKKQLIIKLKKKKAKKTILNDQYKFFADEQYEENFSESYDSSIKGLSDFSQNENKIQKLEPAKFTAQKLKKSIKKKAKAVTGSIQDSVTSSYRAKAEDVDEVEKLFRTAANHKGSIISTIASALLILFVTCSSAFLSYLKGPIQVKVSKELHDKAVALDTGSWIVWALIEPSYFYDLLRFWKNGWLSRDYFAEFRYPDLVKRCVDRLALSREYHIQPENTVDLMMLNLTFPSLIDINKWKKGEVLVHNYSINPKTEQVEWHKKKLYRKNAISFYHVFGMKFSKRNYENDTKIVDIGHDRDKDPDEEMMRRNTIGDLLWYYFDFVHEFRRYCMGLVELNMRYIYYCLFGSLFTSLISLIALFWILVSMKKRMINFYEILFKIDVTHFLFF